jgi:hypothetical protein
MVEYLSSHKKWIKLGKETGVCEYFSSQISLH